jgi:flagellar hook protein FlgE
MTQVARIRVQAAVDGNAPSTIDKVEVATDGTLYALYNDGTRVATYKIPLATVPSGQSRSGGGQRLFGRYRLRERAG